MICIYVPQLQDARSLEEDHGLDFKEDPADLHKRNLQSIRGQHYIHEHHAFNFNYYARVAFVVLAWSH